MYENKLSAKQHHGVAGGGENSVIISISEKPKEQHREEKHRKIA